MTSPHHHNSASAPVPVPEPHTRSRIPSYQAENYNASITTKSSISSSNVTTNANSVSSGLFFQSIYGDFNNSARCDTELDSVAKGESSCVSEEPITVPVTERENELLSSLKPSKAKLTKAERRALQEAQRAAKAAVKGSGNKYVMQPSHKKDDNAITPLTAADNREPDHPPEKERKKDFPPPQMQFDDTDRVGKAKKRSVVRQTEVRHRVELFRHLPQYERENVLPNLYSKYFLLDPMHPAIFEVGTKFMTGEVSGGNARCISMLQAFQEAIKDYTTSPEKTAVRDILSKINSYISFFTECRPLSISMGNAIRFLKTRIAKLPFDLSESDAKFTLCTDIDRFINEKIILADKVIVRHAATKIRDGDVLLTYGLSCIVEMILLYAHDTGKQFHVVVVDSRPKLEGQILIRNLLEKGLTCTYTHINAVSYVMHEVTRVFMGAASIFTNGTVYARVGTACVAMVAHSFRVPVLICCEAYKFSERVQIDSICSNELGDPDAIAKVQAGKGWSYQDIQVNKENIQHLNLMYDVTPLEYVSMIITDYGMVPPTSVPVILREYRREYLWI